ncbi:MAG: pyridoxamine 5'-phosphate oxidase family protein [Chitinophagaceae bacterium]
MSKKNLFDEEGIDKLREIVDKIDICLFCTHPETTDGATCTPMSAQEVDDEGTVWFFSGKNSDKNKEIEKDGKVQLFFSHPARNSYLVLNGEAEISFDKAKIDYLWSPLVKAWFKEGKEDPNISLIKVKTNSAYYWDVDGNRMINFLKMAASAIVGQNLVDSEEGNIKV